MSLGLGISILVLGALSLFVLVYFGERSQGFNKKDAFIFAIKLTLIASVWSTINLIIVLSKK